MKSHYSKRRSTASIRHEINVTPFVDVMLVLLVVFMVAAPMMSTGVSVDLPEGKNAPSMPESQPITITLDKKARLFLRDKELSLEQLVSSLKKLPHVDSERIYLRADKTLPYSKVVELMTLLIASGYSKIALITDNNGNKKR